MNRFLHCIDCGEGFMETPFDQYPEYEYDPNHPCEPVQVIERDDSHEFLVAHHGHRLEDLEIIENSLVSDKNYLEPVKTSYFISRQPTAKKKSLSASELEKRLERKLDIRLSPETIS